jgi:hypothetical protein
LLLVLLLAGCLNAGPSSPVSTSRAPVPSIAPEAHNDAGTCDVPLAPPGENQQLRGREVAVATNPKNPDELAAVFIISVPGMRAAAPNDNDLWNAVARSTDGGRSWRVATLHGYPGDPVVHQPSLPFYGAAALSDPVVAFLSDGTLVHVGLILRAESVDLYAAVFAPGELQPKAVSYIQRGDLRSIGPLGALPRQVDSVPTPIALVFNDGPHMMADPVRPAVYVGWGVETVIGDADGRSVPALSMSTDGVAWTEPAFLEKDGRVQDVTGRSHSAPRPLVGLDGSLHAFTRDITNKKMNHYVSTDHGKSFGAAQVIIEGMENKGGSGYWSNTNPDPMIDRSNTSTRGRMYVTWSDTRNGDRDVFIVRSADNGTTWSAPIRVNDDALKNGADQFYPYETVEPTTGALDVLFMDRRDDTQRHFLTTAYMARSTDGGLTFTNIRLSSKPMDTSLMQNRPPNGASNVGTTLGDYNGITYTKDGVVPVWQDGRASTTQRPFSEIYVCRMVASS